MTKIVQVVAGGKVVNTIMVDPGVRIVSKGARLEWRDGELDAPDGATFMSVENAQIGWHLDGKTLISPPQPQLGSVDLRRYASAARKAIESSGVTVAGIEIATDLDSQSKIIGACLAASRDPAWSTIWNSVTPVDAKMMLAIGDAVQAHINRSFVARGDVWAGIDKGEISTPDGVDAAFAKLMSA